MSTFTLHTPQTAPEGARERLTKAQEKMGFVPNLWAIQAESPEMLEAYQTLAGIFDRTGFSVTERQVVMMTVNVENGCNFCVAAHSAKGFSEVVLRPQGAFRKQEFLDFLAALPPGILRVKGICQFVDSPAPCH